MSTQAAYGGSASASHLRVKPTVPAQGFKAAAVNQGTLSRAQTPEHAIEHELGPRLAAA